MGTIEHN